MSNFLFATNWLTVGNYRKSEEKATRTIKLIKVIGYRTICKKSLLCFYIETKKVEI